MRSSRPMTGTGGQGKALVAQPRHKSVIVRNTNLAVIPPRSVPLKLRARRSFAKLTGYALLAAIFALVGYSYGDPDLRRSIDYQLTLLASAGISSVSPSHRSAVADPLPLQAVHLFSFGQKGPRADRVAFALKTVQPESDLTLRNASIRFEDTPHGQSTAVAGATLFMSAFTRPDETLLPPEFEGPPAIKPDGQWAGLLKNASLSPEEPKTIFGGLTEDEFRARELRCMATAIYFEARDEPIRGQIAVAQVIMNRIRSPFYPKTICGVVYQGERNRHGCQFSFACTGRRLTVNEKEQWDTAVKLAKQVIAGEVWINEIGFATHYHANYVHPGWHELERVAQIGRHIFYKMKPGTIQVALLNEGL